MKEIFSPVTNEERGSCISCQSGKMIPYGIKPLNDETWFCAIDVSFMPHHPGELFKIQRKLQIDEKEFMLAAYIVHSEEKGKLRNCMSKNTLIHAISIFQIISIHTSSKMES